MSNFTQDATNNFGRATVVGPTTCTEHEKWRLL